MQKVAHKTDMDRLADMDRLVSAARRQYLDRMNKSLQDSAGCLFVEGIGDEEYMELLQDGIEIRMREDARKWFDTNVLIPGVMNEISKRHMRDGVEPDSGKVYTNRLMAGDAWYYERYTVQTGNRGRGEK